MESRQSHEKDRQNSDIFAIASDVPSPPPFVPILSLAIKAVKHSAVVIPAHVPDPALHISRVFHVHVPLSPTERTAMRGHLSTYLYPEMDRFIFCLRCSDEKPSDTVETEDVF